MTPNKDLNDDDKIIRMPDLDYTPDPRGIGYVFYSSMKKHKDNIAQIDSSTGEKDTYQSLLQRCVRTALKMRSMGITHEDIVAVCTFNHLNSCVPYVAGLFLGAKVSTLDPTLTVENAVHLLKQVPTNIIFVTEEAVQVIEESIAQTNQNTQIVVFGSSDKYTTFDEFLKPNSEEENFVPHPASNLRDTAIIIYSSGTSGLPKGICIHHYGYLCQAKNELDFKFCNDLVLMFAPYFHWVSVITTLATSVISGKTRILVNKFDPKIIWNVIEKYKPTFITALPFHFYSLYKVWHKDIDTSSLVHLGVGGATLIESLILTIKKMFPTSQLCNGYGQTEMTVILTVFKPSYPKDMEFQKTKLTSCGTGIPGIWYKVVDIDTEEVLGPNQPGELYLKTDFCLNGYYNIDSSHLFDKDGWYKTGDLVYYDEDKCFYVVERLKEFLKYQTYYVLPAVLEKILMQHSEVASALVIGMPHEIDENHPMALVVLKDKNSKVTPEEIKKYVEERADKGHRLPGGVKFVDAIPLSAGGKIRRRDIKQMILRGEL